jgi:hypothetical protein
METSHQMNMKDAQTTQQFIASFQQHVKSRHPTGFLHKNGPENGDEDRTITISLLGYHTQLL